MCAFNSPKAPPPPPPPAPPPAQAPQIKSSEVQKTIRNNKVRQNKSSTRRDLALNLTAKAGGLNTGGMNGND